MMKDTKREMTKDYRQNVSEEATFTLRPKGREKAKGAKVEEHYRKKHE